MVLGEAILCMETSREMCQGKRSCPVSGKIRGDVSGEKKLSRQWETQWGCVRGKDFKEGRSLAIQELSRKMCHGKTKLSSPWEYQRRRVRGKEAVHSMGISNETCQGKINCPVSGKLSGDVSGEKSGGP